MSNSNNSTDKKNARKQGVKELIIGAAIAAAGGLLTYFSHESAKPGQRYTIYTGLIAMGIVYAVYGVIHILFPKVGAKKDSKTDSSAIAEGKEAKDEVVVEEDD